MVFVEEWAARLATPSGAILLAVGAFYVFAGYVAARMMLVYSVIDRALDLLQPGKVNHAERERDRWLLLGAVLVFASGLSLVLLSPLAPWIFALALAKQAVYLFWIAPRRLDPFDEPDEKGRRQTTNAAILFAVATAGVAWAARQGHLAPLPGAGETVRMVLLAVGVAGFLGWIWKQQRMPKDDGARAHDAGVDEDNPPSYEADDDYEPPEPFDMADVEEIRMRAEMGCWPLWPVIEGFQANPRLEEIPLSPELVADLQDWQDEFERSWDMDDPASAMKWTQGEEDDHARRGFLLARRVADAMRMAGREDIRVTFYFHTGAAFGTEENPFG